MSSEIVAQLPPVLTILLAYLAVGLVLAVLSVAVAAVLERGA